jgi:hypothetical protein
MNSFYNSREWKELRFRALLAHGRKCLCCNAKDKPLHVDHIKPISKYPSLKLELSNLQVLCEDCNLGKSNKFETDFRVYKIPEAISVPPGSYCWVKFNNKTVHRWNGYDTLCKGIKNSTIILGAVKESSINKPKGALCSDCKRILYFNNKPKRLNKPKEPKTILIKKKDIITKEYKRLFSS